MKTTITFDSKDLRTIIAKFFGVDESQVIPNRYSYSIEGLTIEQIKDKMESK